MLKLENVSKLYGSKKVLDNINLSVEKGEIFGIVGKSGAGKSTLLKLINLLSLPDSGTISLDGVDLTSLDGMALRRQRSQIGMIFQHFNLINNKTIGENIALPMVISKQYSRSEINERVVELLKIVGLTEHRNSYPSALSGGQKQRVGIARALTTDPKLLLCDEATSALDPETTNSILQLLLDINSKLGITIVMITHETHVIKTICDRVAVVDGGRIIEQGRVVDVVLHPQMPATINIFTEDELIKYIDELRGNLKFGSKVLLLKFYGEVVYQPIIYKLSRIPDLEFILLRANISKMKQTSYGQMLIELLANEHTYTTVFQVLDEMQVSYQVIGG